MDKLAVVFVGLMLAPVNTLGTTLLWAPAEGDVDGYNVYSSIDKGQTWAIQHTVTNPVPNEDGYIEYQFADPDVLTFYRISAYNQAGEAPLLKVLAGWDPQHELVPPQWPDVATLGGKQ